MDCLDDLITRTGAAGFCLYATSDDPDMRYLTRFTTHDPVPVIKKPGENPLMILPVMEVERAERESVAQIITRQQAGYEEIISTEKDPSRITAALIHRCVQGPVVVPPRFPLGLARALEERTQVILDTGSTVGRMRAVKSAAEIDGIRTAQRAVEAAMEQAVRMIRTAGIRDGVLCQDGIPLTSEQVKYAIHTTLLRHGCTADGTIVACGEGTSMPHWTGDGPLRSNQPIVIDIFPRHEVSGYHADMTRTLSRGEPSSAVCDLYRAVRDALALGESAVSAGVSGAECHQRVKDFFTEAGFETGTEGFIHSLGHGIGLEIHERPSLSPSGESLEENQVVTVEPGLYYRGVGGVRIENLGVVKSPGYKRLTEFSTEMIV